MKQKDIVLIAVIVIISATSSYFVSKSVFVKPQNRQQEVEVVQKIDSKFVDLDVRYFNEKSYDPTRVISIGDDNNPDPFSTKKQ